MNECKLYAVSAYIHVSLNGIKYGTHAKMRHQNFGFSVIGANPLNDGTSSAAALVAALLRPPLGITVALKAPLIRPASPSRKQEDAEASANALPWVGAILLPTDSHCESAWIPPWLRGIRDGYAIPPRLGVAGEWHKGLNARVWEMELVRIAVDAIAISYPPTLPSFRASGGSQVPLLLATGTRQRPSLSGNERIRPNYPQGFSHFEDDLNYSREGTRVLAPKRSSLHIPFSGTSSAYAEKFMLCRVMCSVFFKSNCTEMARLLYMFICKNLKSIIPHLLGQNWHMNKAFNTGQLEKTPKIFILWPFRSCHKI